MALALAAEGAGVTVCAREMGPLMQTAEELRLLRGGGVLAVQADLQTPEGCEQVVRETVENFRRLDILVNNVGGGRPGKVGQTTDEDWQAVWDLNVRAAVRTVRLAVPELRKQGGGRIVNVSSIWGRESGGIATYNAAKAALISLSKALSTELAPDRIGVNTVAPGSIRFPGGGWARRVPADPAGMERFVQENIPGGRFGTAEEVA